MKHTLLIAAAISLCSLASCSNPAPSGQTAGAKADSSANKMEGKADKNKKTAMAAEAAVNAHDVNGVFKDAATNFMEYLDGSMPPMPVDSAKKMFGMFMNSFPDFKGENPVYVADDNNVVVIVDWSATFKNDMGPVKATGKTAKFKDVDIFTFDDNGKITSHRNIFPNDAMMMMVGADMAKMKAMMEAGAKKK